MYVTGNARGEGGVLIIFDEVLNGCHENLLRAAGDDIYVDYSSDRLCRRSVVGLNGLAVFCDEER